MCFNFNLTDANCGTSAIPNDLIVTLLSYTQHINLSVVCRVVSSVCTCNAACWNNFPLRLIVRVIGHLQAMAANGR